jgi:hypothetical protein
MQAIRRSILAVLLVLAAFPGTGAGAARVVADGFAPGDCCAGQCRCGGESTCGCTVRPDRQGADPSPTPAVPSSSSAAGSDPSPQLVAAPAVASLPPAGDLQDRFDARPAGPRLGQRCAWLQVFRI